VRLGTSALLAVEESRLTLSARRGCESILEGYTESLRTGGGAAVLAERYRWLRDLAVARLKDQRPFWDHLRSLRTVSGRVDERVRRLLAAALPARELDVRLVHRQAGAGSLGRLRVVALANWRGGMIAREAKPLTASAWLWARKARPAGPRYAELIGRAVRVPDPFLTVQGQWLLHIEVSGPQGQGTADVPLTAVAPPAIPEWLGWLIAGIPIAALLLFLSMQRARRIQVAVPA